MFLKFWLISVLAFLYRGSFKTVYLLQRSLSMDLLISVEYVKGSSSCIESDFIIVGILQVNIANVYSINISH